MKADQKEKCLQAYYRTDIEPTLDRLNQIKDIVSNFEKNGANRLTCALEMKHKDLDEIGIYKPVKYAAVNKHSLGYDKNSKMVKDFTAGINVIFANSNNAELMDFSA